MSSRTPMTQGFSLVELMVVLFITGLASAGIYSVLIQSEAQQRRTGETADMWQQARAALTMIERDVRMAGYGFAGANATTCGQINTYDEGRAPKDKVLIVGAPISSASPAPTSPINSPLQSDALSISYANTPMGGLALAALAGDMPESSAILKVNSAAGFNVGDVIILGEQGTNKPCTQLQVTALPGNDRTLQHNPGGSNGMNPPGGHNIFPPDGYKSAKNVQIYKFGRIYYKRYAISTISRVDNVLDAPALTVQDLNTGADAQPIARGIVSLQIMYGLDTDEDGNVDTYARPNNANWFIANGGFIRTARIALLARAVLPDKNYTQSTPITLFNSDNPAGDNAVVYNVPEADRRFRHQRFVTEVPLRNAIYQGQL